MPRLTVIMAARNAEGTVLRAVRSTLSAMPEDAQLAVWDDGSEDRTAELVDGVADRRVTVIRSDTAKGSGAARRNLVAATDSEYVANIDADDVSLPWRFHVQLARLAVVDASFATTFRFSDGLPTTRWSGGFRYRPDEARLATVIHNVLPHSTMVLRREALERAGSYRALRVAQDYDLWLRLIASGASIERLRIPTAAYRQSANQVSRAADYHARANDQGELRAAWRAAAEAVLGLRPEPGGLSEVQRAALAALPMFRTVKKRTYYRRIIEDGGTFQLLPRGSDAL